MRSYVVSALLVAFVAVSAPSVVFAQTPQALTRWAGIWSLNLAKSKYEPGPAPQRSTLRMEVSEGGLKTVNDTVVQAGTPTFTEVLAKFDGTDREVTNVATPTTRVYKWVNDTTQEWVTKVMGRATTTTRAVMSADGKVLTLTTTGMNAAGTRVNNVQIFERQP